MASDRRAGFLLLEVLAALVVTIAFVGVVLPFAGRIVTHWWSGQTAVEGADAWMQAVARLGDDLAEAEPLSIPGADGLAFRAGPRRVVFVRPKLGDPAAGLETVTEAIVTTAAGEALTRRAAPFDPDTFASEPREGGATTLIEGAFRLRFASVGADGVPRDSWGDAKALPLRLELIATTAKNAPLFPGAIVLPLPVSTA